jgi:hypothetical protein
MSAWTQAKGEKPSKKKQRLEGYDGRVENFDGHGVS